MLQVHSLALSQSDRIRKSEFGVPGARPLEVLMPAKVLGPLQSGLLVSLFWGAFKQRRVPAQTYRMKSPYMGSGIQESFFFFPTVPQVMLNHSQMESP